MLGYCDLDLLEETSVNLLIEFVLFYLRNGFENYFCEMAAILSRRWVNHASKGVLETTLYKLIEAMTLWPDFTEVCF